MGRNPILHNRIRQTDMKDEKTTYTNVAIPNEVYKAMVKYANDKGMKFTKVVEFAILDYLTNATK